MKFTNESLFKDGKGHYAVYVGVHENKAVLSGTAGVIHVETDTLKSYKRLNQGDRVYFKDGEILKVEKTPAPVSEPPAKKTGSTRFAVPNNPLK